MLPEKICYNEEQLKLNKEFLSILKEQQQPPQQPQPQPQPQAYPELLDACIKMLVCSYATIPEKNRWKFVTKTISSITTLTEELQENP